MDARTFRRLRRRAYGRVKAQALSWSRPPLRIRSVARSRRPPSVSSYRQIMTTAASGGPIRSSGIVLDAQYGRLDRGGVRAEQARGSIQNVLAKKSRASGCLLRIATPMLMAA